MVTVDVRICAEEIRAAFAVQEKFPCGNLERVERRRRSELFIV